MVSKSHPGGIERGGECTPLPLRRSGPAGGRPRVFTTDGQGEIVSKRSSKLKKRPGKPGRRRGPEPTHLPQKGQNRKRNVLLENKRPKKKKKSALYRPGLDQRGRTRAKLKVPGEGCPDYFLNTRRRRSGVESWTPKATSKISLFWGYSECRER